MPYNPLSLSQNWKSSKKEGKPIIFIFQDRCCEYCIDFTEILEHPDVQRTLYSYFVPIFINIHEYPDLYDRYSAETGIFHTINTIDGIFLATCHEKSLLSFLNRLRDYRKTQTIDPFKGVYNKPKPYVTSPSIEELSKNLETAVVYLLDGLMESFDHLYGGWGKVETKYPPTDVINFLLYIYHGSRDERLITMCQKTLDNSIRGLLSPNDLFYRYANSRDWNSVGSCQLNLDMNLGILSNLLHYVRIIKDGSYINTLENGVSALINTMMTEDGFFKQSSLLYKRNQYSESNYLTYSNAKALMFLISFYNQFESTINPEIIHSLYNSLIETINDDYEIPHILNSENRIGIILLKDQTFILSAILDYYSSFGDSSHLDLAEKLSLSIIQNFYDNSVGLFKDRNSKTESELIGPFKRDLYPLAENIRMAENLIRLEALTEKEFSRIAKSVLITLSNQVGLSKSTPVPPIFNKINQLLFNQYIQLIIVGNLNDSTTIRLANEVKKFYEPMKVIQILDPKKDRDLIRNKKLKRVYRPAVFVIVDDMVSNPLFYPREIKGIIDSL